MSAAIIITLAKWWLYIGAGSAVLFLTIGIDRIDEDARGAYIFRPLLIPAILLIWPLVLWRWYCHETGRIEPAAHYRPARQAHGRLWLIFGILIPLIFFGSILIRQTPPDNFEPQRLNPTGELRP